jgi:hypothetical protein
MEIDYSLQMMQTIIREPTNRLPVNPAHLKASMNEMIGIHGGHGGPLTPANE